MEKSKKEQNSNANVKIAVIRNGRNSISQELRIEDVGKRKRQTNSCN